MGRSVSDWPWSMEGVAAMIDARIAKSAKRRPYKTGSLAPNLMIPFPVGSRVRVQSTGKLNGWADGATGVVTEPLKNGEYWISLDRPRRDSDGDGPYIAAAFRHRDLRLITRPVTAHHKN